MPKLWVSPRDADGLGALGHIASHWSPLRGVYLLNRNLPHRPLCNRVFKKIKIKMLAGLVCTTVRPGYPVRRRVRA